MQFEKLYGCCGIVRDIQNGDLLPMNSERLHVAITGKTKDHFTKADFDTIYPSFAEKLDPYLEILSCNGEKAVGVRTVLKDNAPSMDLDLLVVLQAFTTVYSRKRSMILPDSGLLRSGMVISSSEGQEIHLLSDIFKKNMAVCLESSLLAYEALKRNVPPGTDVSLVYAAMLETVEKGQNELNEPEGHALLRLRRNGEEYVFDPHNPLRIACVDPDQPSGPVTTRDFAGLFRLPISLDDPRFRTDIVLCEAKSVLFPGRNPSPHYGVFDGECLMYGPEFVAFPDISPPGRPISKPGRSYPRGFEA